MSRHVVTSSWRLSERQAAAFREGFARIEAEIAQVLQTDYGTGSVTVARNGVYTTSNTWLTIPNNLTSGTTYYLGCIIDYDNGLAEVDSSNNDAYHIIKIN